MKKIVLTLLIVWMWIPLFGQSFFTRTADEYLPQLRDTKAVPASYEVYRVDKAGLIRALADAPEAGSVNVSPVKLRVPVPGGKEIEFEMFRTRPMAPELQSRFPDILSYRGIAPGGKRMRLDINRSGVFYTVFAPGESPVVFRIAAPEKYILFYQADQPRPEDHVCRTDEPVNTLESIVQGRQIEIFSDGLIRQYRLAFAADGEFSQFHVQNAINNGTLPSNASDAEKKQAVLEAIVVIINRVNEIYEVDMGITLQLVPNNINLIFLDPNTDPYDNSNPSALLQQNQQTIDNIIGPSNYDIGHVGTTGGGGLARLACVCRDGQKAMGETGLTQPIGDNYAVDFVAHEMGHQFGANHTFANYCGGNRNNSTAVEPGSGTTIMAYAGVCAPNVQDHSDPQFHYVSLSEIWRHVTNYTCAQTSPANNNPPVITVGPDRWIPRKTPFVIEADATDPDGHTLYYTWDEVDVYNDPSGTTNAPPDEDNTTGPMFRVNPVTDQPYRYFPNMADILNGTYGNTWEVLPNVQRILSFQVVARDMQAPGGQIDNDRISLGIDASTGPFRVTSHPSSVNLAPGSTINITWDVAGTTGGNVNCQAVDILFSRDGGRTFTDTLAANVPNDGSETVTLPSNLATCNGHYMVKGRNNYFFDVNKGKIKVNCQCSDYTENAIISIPDNDPNGIASTQTINESFAVEDIKVRVNITHTYVSDLRIKLTSPSGTVVTLFDRNCRSQDDIDIVFADGAPAMNCDSLAIGNTYRPVEPLYNLIGENAQGTWTLSVSDHEVGDRGTLNYWTLSLCKAQSAAHTPRVSDLRLYPVPATDRVYVRFTARSPRQQVTVTDLRGRVIYSRTFEGEGEVEYPVEVGGWAGGVYLFTVIDGDAREVRKVIVR
ncbi:MAG: T9SS type A sorting domain-containing protein [Chlorobi bacterium]|nr:T9SS type A sorting domain-containing protein [Chlorobiota bacterium]